MHTVQLLETGCYADNFKAVMEWRMNILQQNMLTPRKAKASYSSIRAESRHCLTSRHEGCREMQE